jgi:hypothetical protein
MEITLEKIELVKDRTGVSYKEAKEALEATEGNVVDAIIKIEEEINEKVGKKVTDKGEVLVAKIKEYIKKGNISKIVVKKDDEVVLRVPVTVGVVGTVLAPWVTAIGAIAALGARCTVVLIKDDGDIIDLSGLANDTIDDVKDSVKDAAGKAGAVKDGVADNIDDIKDIVKDAASQIKETVSKGKDEAADASAEAGDEPEEEPND